MCEVQINVEGDSIEDALTLNFSADKAAKLKNCSDLIAMLLDERMDIDPDNDEPIEISIDSGIGFSSEEVTKAFKYLEHYNFEPPEYGKIISQEIKRNCKDEYDAGLIDSYDLATIKQLHNCAGYFQIKSLLKLCYIKIGCEVYMDTNQSGAVQKMMEKFNINETYTIHTEQQ